MMRHLFIITAVVLVLGSCKKKYYPEDNVVEPGQVISFSGSIGGKAVDLKVGTNNYYCFSSNQLRADSVLEFSSLLAPADCSTCPSSLQLSLTDRELSASGIVSNADSCFKVGQRLFNGGLSYAPMLQLKVKSNKRVKEVTWYLQNTLLSTDTSTFLELRQQGYVSIQSKVKTESGCENTAESILWLDAGGKLFFTDFSTVAKTINTVQFQSQVSGGKGAYSYEWKFGDGAFSSDENPIHLYQYKGNYPVQLKVTDANNITVVVNYLVVVGADISSCSLGIAIKNVGQQNVKFNGIDLQWRDEQNVVYSTNSCKQPASSYFEILDSKDFEKNERGESGRLLNMRFSAVLSNGTQTIQALVDKATMAVSYK